MITNEPLRSQQDTPLISYGDQTLTRASFWREVERLKDIIGPMRLPVDEFIMLNESHPLRFYTCLFALWDLGLKVTMPTNDYINGITDYGFYKTTIAFDGNDLKATPSKNKADIAELSQGDVIVSSSGSTGAQKGILHVKENLFNNAIAVNKVVKLSGYSSITMLKPYLVSALSHFLVHYISGSHLRFIDLSEAEGIDGYYDENNELAVVGSPVHIIMAASKIDASRAPMMFFSSGDFIYASSIRSIIEKFPKTIFYKAYGLAEVAGRFFINSIDKNTPEAKVDTLGNEIPGTYPDVKDGQMHVRSDYLFSGYILGDDFIPAENLHPSGDLVNTDKDQLTLSGRLSDEIKVGGNKVSLKHIESMASSVLKDDIVVVISQPHDILGNLISIVIQSTHKDRSKTELMTLLRTVLRSHELPHYYYFVDDLPFTQSMKIDRNEISRNIQSLVPVK